MRDNNLSLLMALESEILTAELCWVRRLDTCWCCGSIIKNQDARSDQVTPHQCVKCQQFLQQKNECFETRVQNGCATLKGPIYSIRGPKGKEWDDWDEKRRKVRRVNFWSVMSMSIGNQYIYNIILISVKGSRLDSWKKSFVLSIHLYSKMRGFPRLL
jgi:hypothetical protein